MWKFAALKMGEVMRCRALMIKMGRFWTMGTVSGCLKLWHATTHPMRIDSPQKLRSSSLQGTLPKTSFARTSWKGPCSCVEKFCLHRSSSSGLPTKQSAAATRRHPYTCSIDAHFEKRIQDCYDLIKEGGPPEKERVQVSQTSYAHQRKSRAIGVKGQKQAMQVGSTHHHCAEAFRSPLAHHKGRAFSTESGFHSYMRRSFEPHVSREYVAAIRASKTKDGKVAGFLKAQDQKGGHSEAKSGASWSEQDRLRMARWVIED
jgi:hypothetical protein